MGKAMAATVAIFSLGGLSLPLLTGMLGAFSEQAALGLVGLGLVGASHLMTGRMPSAEGAALGRELKVNG